MEGEKTTWKHTVEDGTATRVLVTGRDQPSEPDFALFSPTFIPSLLFLSLPLDSPIVIDWVSVGRSLDSSKLTQTIGKRIWRSLSLAVSSGANSISLSLLSAFFFINRIQLGFFFLLYKRNTLGGKGDTRKGEMQLTFPHPASCYARISFCLTGEMYLFRFRLFFWRPLISSLLDTVSSYRDVQSREM